MWVYISSASAANVLGQITPNHLLFHVFCRSVWNCHVSSCVAMLHMTSCFCAFLILFLCWELIAVRIFSSGCVRSIKYVLGGRFSLCDFVYHRVRRCVLDVVCFSWKCCIVVGLSKSLQCDPYIISVNHICTENALWCFARGCRIAGSCCSSSSVSHCTPKICIHVKWSGPIFFSHKIPWYVCQKISTSIVGFL